MPKNAIQILTVFLGSEHQRQSKYVDELAQNSFRNAEMTYAVRKFNMNELGV